MDPATPRASPPTPPRSFSSTATARTSPPLETETERRDAPGLDDRFAVRLTMNSEFLDIVRFLYTLQQSPYFFDVEEAEFKRSAKRGQGGVTTHLVLGKDFILTDSNERIEDQGEAL